VVDDEEAVRLVASRLLNKFGYEIVLAVNGREAVAKFREAPSDYAAILLDLTMPQMDGTEALAELRRIEPEIKVVLMSGYNEQDAIKRFAGQGLAAFVQKPFTPDELRRAFQTLTETSTAPGRGSM
jgi:CheY-like chemotaxis protein